MRNTLTYLTLIMVVSSPLKGTEPFRWEFGFSESDHGFVAGFADLPADFDPEFYALTADRRPLPPELGSASALFISGDNHSDDLWMYWKKRLTGLKANATYVLTIEVELASKYATGLFGIGGAPGDSVYFKSGASDVEPIEEPDMDDWLRLNIDKGNQSMSGQDVILQGTIAKPDDENENYVYLTRHNHGSPQVVTTSDDGSLWLIFGTDSGFEGETALYYTRVSVWANLAASIHLWLELESPQDNLRLIWNNGFLQTSIDLENWDLLVPSERPFKYQPSPESSRFWRLTWEQ